MPPSKIRHHLKKRPWDYIKFQLFPKYALFFDFLGLGGGLNYTRSSVIWWFFPISVSKPPYYEVNLLNFENVKNFFKICSIWNIFSTFCQFSASFSKKQLYIDLISKIISNNLAPPQIRFDTINKKKGHETIVYLNFFQSMPYFLIFGVGVGGGITHF